jgi:O-antigen/teichoic acid export membrane protein
MLGTAWSVQMIRAVLLAFIVLALAGSVQLAAAAGSFAEGTVYTDPRLPWMMLAFAACALIQGGESMKLATAQRELRGRELARLELLTQLVAMVVTLVLAWFTRSVYALVAGVLAAALARTVLSHWVLPGEGVRPCWDRPALREIVGFGKWTFLSSILGFLAAHGEKLLLGALLLTASFGVFSIASLLVAALAGVFASINGHVVFARLSEAVRTQSGELSQVYGRVQRVADVGLGLIAGALAMAGDWIVLALYDARYQEAGWMLQALGLGLLALRQQVVEQLMFALGRPQNVMANNLLRALALVVLVPSGHALAGEMGAISAVVLAQFAGWPASYRFRLTQGLLRWSAELVWVASVALGALLGLGIDGLLTALITR